MVEVVEVVVAVHSKCPGDAWVVELAAYGSGQNAMVPRHTDLPTATARALLTWARSLSGQALAIRHRVEERRRKEPTPAWLPVLLLSEAQADADLVSDQIAQGFSVDLGFGLEAAGVVDWLISNNYRIVANSNLVEHPDAKLLVESVSGGSLGLLKALSCKTVVVSAHDMDPVYVIRIP